MATYILKYMPLKMWGISSQWAFIPRGVILEALILRGIDPMSIDPTGIDAKGN